jgi:hypothetical protein
MASVPFSFLRLMGDKARRAHKRRVSEHLQSYCFCLKQITPEIVFYTQLEVEGNRLDSINRAIPCKI